MELLFRELKTLYELDEFDTSNPAVVEILLYAAILMLVVSRELLDLVWSTRMTMRCSHRNASISSPFRDAVSQVITLSNRLSSTQRSH